MSREKVREYAAATGAGPVAEAGDVLAPPTFAACFTLTRLGQVVDDPELGAHWNLVHSRQEYTFHRPVAVGDVLSCRPLIAGITARGRMDLLTLQTDCVDAGTQEPVVTSLATILFFEREQARAADAGGQER